MTSAYNGVMTDSKLAKKKPLVDPSLPWTVELTKYMQDSVWRICNESMVLINSTLHVFLVNLRIFPCHLYSPVAVYSIST